MNIPKFWAESRIKERVHSKTITIRRFGWSSESQLDADLLAQQRAEDAMAMALQGQSVNHREWKTAYNGGEGLPIREEILEEVGDVVITRNSYGAHCLNTPDVLFADVDLEHNPPGWVFRLSLVLTVTSFLTAGILIHRFLAWILLFVAAFYLFEFLNTSAAKLAQRWREPPEKSALERIAAFQKQHSSWGIRTYQTPAGFRVMATHRVFDPLEQEVEEIFSALGVDSIYAMMCKNQRCFRARLSPKPWRMGISDHMRPRPGVWPVAPERMAARMEWIQKYEAKAADFSACKFIAQTGNSVIDPKVQAVIGLHDSSCRAGSNLPLA